ncbi:putative F-box protein At1g32420 [Lycium barbarum]|uniref:putative F-box protein At1g32420 n=1 Tax=Lycium barbarum TaxID=112863 RepID=UPI00293F6FE0|nr:putative F-box protein At1g32420 [Lycium barbarum]
MVMTTAAFHEEKNIKSSRKIPSIPQEIIFDIFSWLPVESLMRFKCISKSFNSLVSKSYFVDIHQCHSRTRTKFLLHEWDLVAERNFYYTIEQNEDGKASRLRIEDYLDGLNNFDMKRDPVECVNGLFLFWRMGRHPAVICNPNTREVRFLPGNPYTYDPGECLYLLGFEPEEKVYKVLFLKYVVVQGHLRSWVFSLGIEESWKEIESIPYFYCQGRNVCINGVIYQLTCSFRETNIVAFDMKTESFRTIDLWKVKPQYRCYCDLIEVKEKLAVLEDTLINGETNLWILGNGQHEGWERHVIIGFPMESPINHHFLFQTYGGKIIFVARKKCDEFIYLCYDVTRKSLREHKINGFCEKGLIQGSSMSSFAFSIVNPDLVVALDTATHNCPWVNTNFGRYSPTWLRDCP